MDAARITELVAQGGVGRKRTPANRWFDGYQWISGKAPTATVGKFEGKVGSIRRSRKGATRRLPNGSRVYYSNSWDVPIVVAYTNKPQ